jgi:hypothetical protein
MSAELPEPSPENIRALLEREGWTQAFAADLVGVDFRSMKRYVATGKVRRVMPSGLWELLLLRAGAHPSHVLAPRSAPFEPPPKRRKK